MINGKGNSLASDQMHVHCETAVESGDRDRTFTVKNIVTVHSSCSDQSEINQTGDEWRRGQNRKMNKLIRALPSSPPRRQKSQGGLWLESNLSILRVSTQLLVITSVRTAAVRRSLHYQYS